MSSQDSALLLTADGYPLEPGMHVRDGWRGTGVVLRTLRDGVVVRWDRDLPEPARTTIVGPQELSRLARPPSGATTPSSRPGPISRRGRAAA